jgi:hypothetical protein
MALGGGYLFLHSSSRHHLFRSYVRANGDGGGLRCSWTKRTGRLGRAEEGEHDGAKRKGGRGVGASSICLSSHGDHGGGDHADLSQPRERLSVFCVRLGRCRGVVGRWRCQEEEIGEQGGFYSPGAGVRWMRLTAVVHGSSGMPLASWAVASVTTSSVGFSAAENPERGGLGCLNRGDDWTCTKVFDGVCLVVGEGGRRSTIALGS